MGSPNPARGVQASWRGRDSELLLQARSGWRSWTTGPGRLLRREGWLCECASGIEIEKYPERVEKVKEVVVLNRKPDALVVRYTEGAMGISSTSTMRWSFTGLPIAA